MSHKSFVWLCLLPLGVVTAAFFLLPMARLVVTGAEGPLGLAGYLAVLTEPRYRATLINTVVLAAATTIVSHDTISGRLACSGNVPPPSNAGSANSVSGHRSGQCAAPFI